MQKMKHKKQRGFVQTSPPARAALLARLDRGIADLRNARGRARSYDEKMILAVLLSLYASALRCAERGKDVPRSPYELQAAELCQNGWPKVLRENWVDPLDVPVLLLEAADRALLGGRQEPCPRPELGAQKEGRAVHLRFTRRLVRGDDEERTMRLWQAREAHAQEGE